MSTGSSPRPLSVGNIVSIGFKLYGAHRNTYLKLALFAQLWLLIPIYGWAKSCSNAALISRLAFKELINQPEPLDTARQDLQSRLWSFLILAIRVGFFLVLIYFGMATSVGILVAILWAILGSFGAILGGVVGGIALITTLIWYYSRWVIAEVPLAIESGISTSEGMTRSWQLTKSSAKRVSLVVTVAFLVTLPIVTLTSYVPQVILLTVEAGSSAYWLIYAVSWFLSLAGGILVIPFWQTIKAVLYYDLRSRREGLDMQLRDSPSSR